MNRDTLKQIMVDQKDIYLNNPLIARHYPLEENINYCFVGIRRCGKSYMMYQQIQTLLEKNRLHQSPAWLKRLHGFRFRQKLRSLTEQRQNAAQN